MAALVRETKLAKKHAGKKVGGGNVGKDTEAIVAPQPEGKPETTLLVGY